MPIVLSLLKRKSFSFDLNSPMSTAGLYIHVPFCKLKCPYCGFYSIVSTYLIPKWLDALKKEVLFYKDQFDQFNSLYIGGGTPSLLDLKNIENILDYVFNHFRITSDAEITLEANPGDITNEKADGLKSLGINRINLGVQSFNDQDLEFLGRRHKAHEAEKALEVLRAQGFMNIGVDLIYGLKRQSIEKWKQTLKHLLRFNPEHVSCYQLTIEDNTPFQRIKNQGLLDPVGKEDEIGFFLTSSELLEKNGYTHYEISNFARGEAYCSRHNLKYWDHTPYLGLGPSAHSFKDSRRWWNIRSVRRYCDLLEQGKLPVEGYEELTNEQIQLETVFLGFRTQKGLDLKNVVGNPDISAMLSQLKDSGHIQIDHNKITLTKKGFLVADRLPLYFV